MSTTAFSAPKLPSLTNSLVPTTLTTDGLVVALSASESTLEIGVAIFTAGSSLSTHQLTIPYTGTTAFSSESALGFAVYTVVETSWTRVTLSTITSLHSESSTAKTTSRPTRTPIPSSGLSTGAKAGIGVGISLGVLFLAAVIVGCLLIRRRKKRRIQIQTATRVPGYNVQDKPELDAGMYGIDDHAKPQIIDHKVELGGDELSSKDVYAVDQNGPKHNEPSSTEIPSIDGRVELGGKMISPDHSIKRKQIGSSRGQSTVNEKEIVHDG